MELHPSSFVETGGCTGPRYIRSQPNRESGGVLLNSVTNKYVAEFDLPYRNIVRYVKEIEANWPKLDPRQRDIVKNSLSMFSKTDGTEADGTDNDSTETVIKENFGTEGINEEGTEGYHRGVHDMNGCIQYLAENPSVRVYELLNQLDSPNQSTKDSIKAVVGEDSLETTLESLDDTLRSWAYDNSYYKSGWSAWGFLFLLILIFLLLGVGTGYNCK